MSRLKSPPHDLQCASPSGSSISNRGALERRLGRDQIEAEAQRIRHDPGQPPDAKPNHADTTVPGALQHGLDHALGDRQFVHVCPR